MSDQHRWVGVSIFRDLGDVIAWFRTREGRFQRQFCVGVVCVYLAVSAALIVWDPTIPAIIGGADHKGQEQSGKSLVLGVTMMLVLVASPVLALHYKAKLIRLDRRLADQHTAYYRWVLEGEFAEKEERLLADRAKWENEREEWKAKTQNELYELILGQVERGVLGPRPPSRDE